MNATKTIIGEAGLFNSFNDLTNLEIGYIVDSKYWRNGFGTEICRSLIDYGFKTLKLKRITARMYASNFASVRVAQKCGMRKIEEGIAENGNAFYAFCNEND